MGLTHSKCVCKCGAELPYINEQYYDGAKQFCPKCGQGYTRWQDIKPPRDKNSISSIPFSKVIEPCEPLPYTKTLDSIMKAIWWAAALFAVGPWLIIIFEKTVELWVEVLYG